MAVDVSEKQETIYNETRLEKPELINTIVSSVGNRRECETLHSWLV